VVSSFRQVSKLQAYKTRPKEFGALEFSAGNGKMSFSIVMVSARGACPCPMVQTFVHSSFPGSTLTEPDFSSYLSKVMPILLLGTSKERRVSLRLGLCSAYISCYKQKEKKHPSLLLSLFPQVQQIPL